MTILQELRFAGAQVSLSPSGGIALKGVPSNLLAEAKARKDELTKLLQVEQVTGLLYGNSRLAWLLNEIYEICDTFIESGIAQKEAEAYKKIVWEIDRAASVSMADGERAIKERGEEAHRLMRAMVEAAGEPQLAGRNLFLLARRLLVDEPRAEAAFRP